MSSINAISGGAGFGVSSSFDRDTQGMDGLSIDDFYTLLATQMQYQDADNPMDTSEMMSMMVQTQMIDSIVQMTTTNMITYASSMVGKTVTMAEYDETTGMYEGENTTGVVTGMLMGDNPILYVDGKPYYISQIMTIGEVPEEVMNGGQEDSSVDGEDTETDTETDTSTDVTP